MSSCEPICTQTWVCIPMLWLKMAQVCWSNPPSNIWLRGQSLCSLLKMLAISTLRPVTPLTSQVRCVVGSNQDLGPLLSEIHTMSVWKRGIQPSDLLFVMISRWTEWDWNGYIIHTHMSSCWFYLGACKSQRRPLAWHEKELLNQHLCQRS